MKKTDVAMIILIASISVGVAFGIASAVPQLKVSDMKQQVKKATPISSDLAPVDPRLFSSDAVNPTQQTIIGSQ